jgi:hypothetical protein
VWTFALQATTTIEGKVTDKSDTIIGIKNGCIRSYCAQPIHQYRIVLSNTNGTSNQMFVEASAYQQLAQGDQIRAEIRRNDGQVERIERQEGARWVTLVDHRSGSLPAAIILTVVFGGIIVIAYGAARLAHRPHH